MLDTLLNTVTPSIAALLGRALEGKDLDEAGLVALSEARGRDLWALVGVADALRAEQAGERVSYVVNRNINFTNVCLKSCRFCAFARNVRSEEGYFLEIDEVLRRALEARALGATEVCLQAGLAPLADPLHYDRLLSALRDAAPELHLHAYSPEEVKYAAELSGRSIERTLTDFRDAGLGSLPGTSAEILDDGVRHKIAPGRITSAEWIEVITIAHRLGIRTTATMMFGHVETPRERVRHLLLLRSIQRETGGFTELVPLSFVHEEAPLFARSLAPGLRAGPTGDEVRRVYAIARLAVGRDIPNLQASWVKDGLRGAQMLLGAGANDLGGTLMNESISTTAGARHGQLTTPAELRRIARDAGRIPVERFTDYRVRRSFELEPEEPEPLDAAPALGSYAELVGDPRFRYSRPSRARSEGSSTS